MKKLLVVIVLFLEASFSYAGIPKPIDFAKPNVKQLNKLEYNFSLNINNNSSYDNSNLNISIWDDSTSSFVFYGTFDQYYSSTPDITDGDYYTVSVHPVSGTNNISGALLDSSSNVITSGGGSTLYNTYSQQLGSSYGVTLNIGN